MDACGLELPAVVDSSISPTCIGHVALSGTVCEPPSSCDQSCSSASSEYIVILEKTLFEQRIGICVDSIDGGILQIDQLDDGLVVAYNDTVRDTRKVKAGDSIVEVNGVRGDNETMLAIMRSEQKLECVIRRSSVSSRVDQLTSTSRSCYCASQGTQPSPRAGKSNNASVSDIGFSDCDIVGINARGRQITFHISLLNECFGTVLQMMFTEPGRSFPLYDSFGDIYEFDDCGHLVLDQPPEAVEPIIIWLLNCSNATPSQPATPVEVCTRYRLRCCRLMVQFGFDVLQLRKAGLTAAELAQEGFQSYDLAQGGFTADDVLDAGFCVSAICKSFTLSQLRSAGFVVGDLISAFSVVELIGAGFSSEEVQPWCALCNPRELIHAGFTVPQLRGIPFTAGELINEISVLDLVKGGFTLEEVQPWCSLKEAHHLLNAGFTVEELRQARFTELPGCRPRGMYDLVDAAAISVEKLHPETPTVFHSELSRYEQATLANSESLANRIDNDTMADESLASCIDNDTFADDKGSLMCRGGRSRAHIRVCEVCLLPCVRIAATLNKRPRHLKTMCAWIVGHLPGGSNTAEPSITETPLLVYCPE